MAEYTITIKDIDGGIRIGLQGEGEASSLAGITAMALVFQAKRAAKSAKLAQAVIAPCPCPKCQAERTAPLARKATGPEGCNCALCQDARINNPKPTLH